MGPPSAWWSSLLSHYQLWYRICLQSSCCWCNSILCVLRLCLQDRVDKANMLLFSQRSCVISLVDDRSMASSYLLAHWLHVSAFRFPHPSYGYFHGQTWLLPCLSLSKCCCYTCLSSHLVLAVELLRYHWLGPTIALLDSKPAWLPSSLWA